MATEHIVKLLDDIDGSEGDVETLQFSLGGVEHEIDLNGTHRQSLRDALQPYIAAARRVRTTAASTSVRDTSARKREFSQAVRAWARDKGIVIAERGRIPAEVVEHYRQETQGK